jgi:putative methionine-R-sulfoxide reductase with GAF domain
MPDTPLIPRAIVWRDYPSLLRGAGLSYDPPPPPPPAHDRRAAMARAVSLLWAAFHDQHLSWIGFYDKVEGADEMVLVCREPKPACSPIGLHGMCGRCWTLRRGVIVPDVATLGANYIACDPRDRSEAVVPLLDDDGTCRGVLDADSYETNAFDEHDVQGMTKLLVSLGLTSPASLSVPPVRL